MLMYACLLKGGLAKKKRRDIEHLRLRVSCHGEGSALYGLFAENLPRLKKKVNFGFSDSD